jgi:Immunity protein 51
MELNNFEAIIAPFFWTEHENSVSVCLYVGEYKTEIFETREEEGFEGNGYDWASLAQVFLEEQKPELIDVVKFDPEGSMFCAYSSDTAALKTFILSFKEACENKTLILDLFSRAELD